MKENAGRLSERERLFCEIFADCGSVREAAVQAGYEDKPYITGIRLLKERRIVSEIKRIKKKRYFACAADGLRRLAFGDISDAVRLVAGDEQLFGNFEKMNLFNISEIKKPKDGSLEIKFFDRIKAMEALARLDVLNDSSDGAKSFFAALEDSATESRQG